jgi:hypothetical protein
VDWRLGEWQNTDTYRGVALEAKRVRAACEKGRCSTAGWGCGSRATFGPKTATEQRRHLKIGGLKRVSLLRFFSRLKRNEVPPRTGANSNKQENPT